VGPWAKSCGTCCVAAGQLTKSDVYAFGVMLLELLTGKRAMDQTQQGMPPLTAWAQQYLNQRKPDIGALVDPCPARPGARHVPHPGMHPIQGTFTSAHPRAPFPPVVMSWEWWLGVLPLLSTRLCVKVCMCVCVYVCMAAGSSRRKAAQRAAQKLAISAKHCIEEDPNLRPLMSDMVETCGRSSSRPWSSRNRPGGQQ